MGFDKRGQQEIVGFVLIVVLVVVALMVFLIISVRDSGDEEMSVGVSNVLDVVMRATTGCAIPYVPKYNEVEDLFKSCFKGSSCSNLDKTACEYLNESFGDIISSVVLSDASVEAWSADFSERSTYGHDSGEPDGAGILRWSEGNCTGQSSGAQRVIDSGNMRLIVRLRLCSA